MASMAILLKIFFSLFLGSVVLGWELSTKDGLESALVSNDYTLAAFVRPDEESSKSLEPEWASAATKGTENLIAINCDVDWETCDAHGISSSPEIHLFQGDKKLAGYQGPKRAAAILHFATRRKRPAVTRLSTLEEVTAFKTADETVFVAYLREGHVEESVASKAFSELAETYRDEFSFGVITDLAAAQVERLETSSLPAVICYKLVDGDSSLLASFDAEDSSGQQRDAIVKKLDDWLREAWRPVIAELTPWTRHRLLHRAWPMIYLFAPTSPARLQLRQNLYRFARSYYDSLTAALVDPVDYPELMAQLGLDPSKFPAGAVHQLSKDRIYPYPHATLDSKALQKWGLDVWQGKVKPWVPPAGATMGLGGIDGGGNEPGRIVSTRKVNVRSGLGVNIKVAGHDEL